MQFLVQNRILGGDNAEGLTESLVCKGTFGSKLFSVALVVVG